MKKRVFLGVATIAALLMLGAAGASAELTMLVYPGLSVSHIWPLS